MPQERAGQGHGKLQSAFMIWRLWTCKEVYYRSPRESHGTRTEALNDACEVVTRAVADYAATLISELCRRAESDEAIDPFARAVLHRMAVWFFQYAERHFRWIQKASKTMHSQCIDLSDWFNFKLGACFEEVDDIVEAHPFEVRRRRERALAFAMLGVPRLGERSKWGDLNQDLRDQIARMAHSNTIDDWSWTLDEETVKADICLPLQFAQVPRARVETLRQRGLLEARALLQVITSDEASVQT